MASIRKDTRKSEKTGRREDIRWNVQYTDPGGTRRTKSFATRTEAKRFVSEVEHTKNQGTYLDPKAGRTPYREVAEEWFRTTVHVKPRTLRGYRRLLDDRLLPKFGEQPVSSITRKAIRSYVAAMQRDDRAPQTIRNCINVLRASLDLAVEERMIADNPAKSTRRFKLPTNESTGREVEHHYLTAAEVERLANAIEPAYRSLIHFAVSTGLRYGECAALRVRDVDFLRRRLQVRAGLDDNGARTSTKNKKPRTIGLPKFLVELLSVDLAASPRGPLDSLFPGMENRGRFYNPVYQKAVRAAGLQPLTFHDLRHTCASLLIAQNIHPKAIAARLGHSDGGVLVLRTYGHLYPTADEQTTDALDALFPRAA
jgi:integrase